MHVDVETQTLEALKEMFYGNHGTMFGKTCDLIVWHSVDKDGYPPCNGRYFVKVHKVSDGSFKRIDVYDYTEKYGFFTYGWGAMDEGVREWALLPNQ